MSNTNSDAKISATAILNSMLDFAYILFASFQCFRIMRFVESGLHRQWTEDAMPQSDCDRRKVLVAATLSLQNISGAIMILLIGVIMSACLPLGEKASRNCASDTGEAGIRLETVGKLNTGKY